MSTHRLGFALFAGSFFASAPGAAQRHDLTLTERWRTKGSASVTEFASVSGIAESAAGDVWVSDGLNNVLVAVDAQGRHMRRIARTGDGPGEVRAPSLVARVPSGGMAVYDISRESVDLFGDDGTFMRRVRLAARVMNPKGFAMLPNGEVLLSGGLLTAGGAVHRFASDGRLVANWGETARARNPRAVELVSGGPVAVLHDGLVLYSQAAPHRIALYTAAGEQRRLIASNPSVVPPMGDEFVFADEGRRAFRWFFPQSAGVYSLANGNILNVVWNQEANTSTWEVYRPDGSLVVRKRFARAYRPWALARDGDVLATVVDSDTDEVAVVRLALRVT